MAGSRSMHVWMCVLLLLAAEVRVKFMPLVGSNASSKRSFSFVASHRCSSVSSCAHSRSLLYHADVLRDNAPELKKAGNLRNAFGRTSGDAIAIFDADFCPRYSRTKGEWLETGRARVPESATDACRLRFILAFVKRPTLACGRACITPVAR